MELSIIVLTFNSKHCISKCLDDAFDAMAGAGIEGEIVVFENGSVDGTAEYLKNRQSKSKEKLRILYSEKNLGTTRSRNAAIKVASGKNLMILDSDAFLTVDCLSALLEYLEANPETGMVGPRLNYKSGNFQLSYDRFPTLGHKLKRYFFLRQMEQTTAPAESLDVDYLISACWLLRKKVYEDVGPMDENIFYAPEDVDYCLRVWLCGYKITYLPRVAMVHDAQELSRGIKINLFLFKHAFGLLYYFRKHGYLFSTVKLKALIAERLQNRLSSSGIS